jgi:hypothetical protein
VGQHDEQIVTTSRRRGGVVATTLMTYASVAERSIDRGALGL